MFELAKRKRDLLQKLGEEHSDKEEIYAELELISKLRASRPEVPWNSLINAGASLIGVLLILKYEELNILTSKALHFVKRPH